MANQIVVPHVNNEAGVGTPGIDVRSPSTVDRAKILCLFGTRPEVIKLAPIIRDLKRAERGLEIVTICSGQHTSLLRPLLDLFEISPDHDLEVMQPRQTPSEVCVRVIERLEPLLAQ